MGNWKWETRSTLHACIRSGVSAGVFLLFLFHFLSHSASPVFIAIFFIVGASEVVPVGCEQMSRRLSDSNNQQISVASR